MRPTKRSVVVRRWAAFAGAALTVAACSGGGSDDAAPGASAAASEPESATTAVVVDESLDDRPPDSTTTTTATSTTTTTTTEPPPAVLPVGAVWQTNDIGDVAGTGVFQRSITTVGDEAWILGARANAPVVWRSGDGVDWTQILVQAPPADGALTISGMLPRGDGFLAWGSRSTGCFSGVDAGDGFQIVGVCDRHDGVIYLSDDGNEWRRVDPPAMQVGGNESIRIEDVTEVAGGFVAIGTVRRADWHARLWFSPDGENWDLVTELRGADGPMSGREVHWDGTTLVVMTHEHPCSQNDINFNTPGWILGTSWARHLRMWSGSDVASLVPIAPEEHPILEPPLVVDCGLTTGTDLFGVPYPDATGQVIGGELTLLDLTPTPEVETTDDGDEPPPDPYRLVALTPSGWASSLTDGVEKGSDVLIELGGAPALVRSSAAGRGRVQLGVAARSDDGTWMLEPGLQPIVANRISGATGFGGAVLAIGALTFDALVTGGGPDDPRTYVVARSEPTREDEWAPCAPAAGVSCEQSVFERLSGYPDFSGADFSGATLRFADFGEGDYTDATFAGSTLTLATSGESTFSGAADFAGADFTGADLRGAMLRDVAGADFTGANLEDAQLGFSEAPISLEGANLIGVELIVIADADGEDPTLSISLAGLDLTDADVEGPLGDGEVRLIIEDLRGAVLDGMTFYAVDLSSTLFDEGVDFSDVDVWDNSLCPDGEPPSDGAIGTCVRDATVDG